MTYATPGSITVQAPFPIRFHGGADPIPLGQRGYGSTDTLRHQSRCKPFRRVLSEMHMQFEYPKSTCCPLIRDLVAGSNQPETRFTPESIARQSAPHP